jgi:ABC-type nitrate/sulfonate/bicarbonate transport system substrate-binding protein
VLHSLPPLQFAPFFVAAGRGLFDRAGIEIETIYDAARQRSVELLRNGEIDCFLSGPLRTFDLAGKGVEPIMASIAVLNDRCPFYLIGSGPGDRRPLETLRGKRIILRRAAPPVKLLMYRLLRLAGIAPESIAWVNAREGQTELEALREGAGDFALLAEPEVEAVIAGGRGHIAVNLPQEFGPLQFASIVAPHGFIDRKPVLARALIGAVQEAKDWMSRAPAADVAGALAQVMPDTPAVHLTGAVARGQRDGMWAGGPALSRWHYEILRDAYTGEDSSLKPVSFSEGVDNRVAHEVAATRPFG